MADLLTRLAERAIGTMPVAMPVLRPIFAAPGKLETDDVDRPPAISEAVPIWRTERSEAAPSPAAREPFQHPETAQPRSPKPSPETREPVKPAKNPATPRLTLEQVIRQIYREPQIPATAAPAPLAKNPETPIALPVRREPRDSNPPLNDLTRPPAPTAPYPQPANSRMLFRPPVREAHRPVDATLAQSRLPVNDSRAGSPAPEVHVSIGRIELKAAAPPAPPARQPMSARPAHLQLDEYLRRRRGARL